MIKQKNNLRFSRLRDAIGAGLVPARAWKSARHGRAQGPPLQYFQWVFAGLICTFLCACSSSSTYAPVASVGAPPIPAAGIYCVKSGDTLYSIAWAYAIDYRQLAAFNHLAPPYTLELGQAVYLRAAVSSVPVLAPAHTVLIQALSRRPPLRSVYRWLWPVRGRLREGFSSGYGGNPGIDISGYVGEPIRATAAGTVVYSGTGVKAYGNLIIIKHNDSYLSAYAYNQRNLLRQGAVLKAGQVIATMGKNNAGVVLLHFEIRRNGQPVNPLSYLG